MFLVNYNEDPALVIPFCALWGVGTTCYHTMCQECAEEIRGNRRWEKCPSCSFRFTGTFPAGTEYHYNWMY